MGRYLQLKIYDKNNKFNYIKTGQKHAERSQKVLSKNAHKVKNIKLIVSFNHNIDGGQPQKKVIISVKIYKKIRFLKPFTNSEETSV